MSAERAPVDAEAAVGTRSREVVERVRRVEGGGLRTFVEEWPPVWARAEGCWVEDPDGRRYLDLYAGFAVGAVGYGHPRVVEAIRRQAGTLIHCPSAYPSPVRAEFLEALASIAPPGLTRVLPAVTGAMANELALAVARTRRPHGEVVTFAGSYFGRGAGVVGLAGKERYRRALAVPTAGRFVPYPYPFRMGAAATDTTMAAMEDLVAEGVQPSAVILEPIQGNGGVLIPPSDFLPRLRELCDRTGALLIADEIQSGCGRTGRMWAVEHTDVVPDLMTVGKGIGGGMAVAAVLGREELLRWPPDTYASTFLTNNVNLAAAVAAVSVLRDEDLPARAARLGGPALGRLRERVDGVRGVGEVRSIGLWAGIELVTEDGRASPEIAGRIVRLARDRGVLLGRGGHDENVVKVSPPLVIGEDELTGGIDAVAESVEAAAREEGA